MDKSEWTEQRIREWVESQTGPDYWYQTIPVKHGIVTPGKHDSRRRVEQMRLPEDLSGKTVLDIGCNSGMLCFECKRRGADRVVGIDLQANRLAQARTLAEITGLKVDFKEFDLFRAAELGCFDLVFCIAVLTEITDLIAGLEALKRATKGVLYVEIATVETFPPRQQNGPRSVAGRLLWPLVSFLHQRWAPDPFPRPLMGAAKLRRIESRMMTGWSLVPDRAFLDAVMGDEFDAADMGPSVRYNLFRLERKEETGNEPGPTARPRSR